MNLSFAGCGFMGLYHVGVVACLRKYAPDLCLKKVSGASAGAMAAACLLCDAPLGDITNQILQIAIRARSRVLGPFSPSFNIDTMIREGLQKFLPENAHVLVSGKINISVTRVSDGKNIILTHFDTKEELIQALACSSFIPFFSGVLPPKFRGVRYMDGGISDNLLVLDEKTITVSPFCGETDICPRDSTSARLFHIVFANTSIEVSRNNLYRLANIMFPPEPETLSKICQQGFDDARRYLQQNDLIGCNQCISDSAISYSNNALIDPCNECETQKMMVLHDRLPDTVLLLLENAINNANNNMKMGLLSIVTLPYAITADVVYATYLKFAHNIPKAGANLLSIGDTALTFLLSLLFETLKKQTHSYTKVTCQLAVNEFISETEHLPSCYGGEMSGSTVQNQFNIDFTLNLETSHEAYSEYSSKYFFDDSQKNFYDEIDRSLLLFDNKPDGQNIIKGQVLSYS